MDFSNGPAQHFLIVRYGNKVNVSEHLAPRPDLDDIFLAAMCHHLDIGEIILIMKKKSSADDSHVGLYGMDGL